MPYRHAHRWIVALVPLIAVAFWPGYFGQLHRAPFALHAHGITASLWIALVGVQSWSIHARRVALHRALGLATFVLVPAFAAGGALAVHSMASLHLAQATPFHSAFGARLVIADGIAAPTLIGLVAWALVQRRRVRLHAAALLATVILVLPPVLGRLVGYVPGMIAASGTLSVHPFAFGFHGGELVSLLLCLWLARRDRASSLPFLVVASACLGQIIGFETLGRSAAWSSLLPSLVAVPATVLAGAAALLALMVLWWSWTTVPPRRSAGTTALTAT